MLGVNDWAKAPSPKKLLKTFGILKITTKIINISKVKILFHQQIKKNEELLVDSEILITPVFFNGKIAKIPNEMLEKFST